MRRYIFMASLAVLAVAAVLALVAAEHSMSRIGAPNGTVELTQAVVEGPPILVVGWQELPNGSYDVHVSGDFDEGDVSLYLPLNTGMRLYVGQHDASAWTDSGSGVYTVPTPLLVGSDLILVPTVPGVATGANLCLFVGARDALLASQQGTAFVRMFIAGIDCATALYALSLWMRKRSERYLLPLVLYAATVAVRILRRSAPFLAENAVLGVLFSFPFGSAATAAGDAALNSLWSVFVDLGLRYLVLRAFLPTKLGGTGYFTWCTGWCAAGAVVAAVCPNPLVVAWLPVLVRLACVALEFAVIARAYVSGRYPDTVVLLVAWTLMFSLWAFNRACELGVVDTYSIGAQVGLGGIQETVLLFGLVFAINSRFAGKFAQADDLSKELAQLNTSLEASVAEKTRELSDAFNRLQEVQRQREEFLSNMAHNIKTPLFSIGGYVEMANAVMERDSQEAHHCLGIVAKNVARVQGMVQKLLLSFRIESGRVQVHAVFQDVAPIVVQAVETVGPKAEERAVTVEIEGRASREKAADSLRCRVDDGLLMEALENILDNAVTSCGPGGRVQVTTEKAAGAVRILIRDNGAGMRPEVVPHIFERYYSSREDGAQGTGIGLSIAKGLIEKMGGSISVQSVWGSGSVFTVTLDATRKDGEDKQGV